MTLPKAYLLCFGSILAIILGAVLANFVPENATSLCVGSGFVLHAILLLAGMAVWAGAKGYSPAVGVLLGLFLSLLGLAILVFLPDKSPKGH